MGGFPNRSSAAMPTKTGGLTPDQVARFKRDGFLIDPSLRALSTADTQVGMFWIHYCVLLTPAPRQSARRLKMRSARRAARQMAA